ncbi:MAG: hypothetical protein LBB85_01410 [Dysgonamonadaceae bacterium]|jgi:hypothetical protein|nr:hypothetical protein [Dysgonamonadaceae bacterium]
MEAHFDNMKIVSFSVLDNNDRLKIAELIRTYFKGSNIYETTNTDGYWIHVPEECKGIAAIRDICLSREGVQVDYANFKH